MFAPRAFQRRQLRDAVDTRLVDQAAARARDILATHEVEPLPEDAGMLIDSAIRRYRETAR
jgi:hypothetical protein